MIKFLKGKRTSQRTPCIFLLCGQIRWTHGLVFMHGCDDTASPLRAAGSLRSQVLPARFKRTSLCPRQGQLSCVLQVYRNWEFLHQKNSRERHQRQKEEKKSVFIARQFVTGFHAGYPLWHNPLHWIQVWDEHKEDTGLCPSEVVVVAEDQRLDFPEESTFKTCLIQICFLSCSLSFKDIVCGNYCGN